MIKLHKKAQKSLENLNEPDKSRIKLAVLSLPDGDCARIEGKKNQYRLRVGNMRVLFSRMEGGYFIEKIERRGQVYKGGS